MIQLLKKLFNLGKASDPSITDTILELSNLKAAEKIVNEFGQAITKGTVINRQIVEKAQNETPEKIAEWLINKDGYYYALLNKFDSRLLPHNKKTIENAIKLLLENETDSKRKDDLMIGLIYLDDFIDLGKV